MKALCLIQIANRTPVKLGLSCFILHNSLWKVSVRSRGLISFM